MQVAHDDAAVRAATVEAGQNLVQAFLALKQPIVVAGDGECPLWPAAEGMLWARRYLLIDEPAETLVRAREIAGCFAALPPRRVPRRAGAVVHRSLNPPKLALNETVRTYNQLPCMTRRRYLMRSKPTGLRFLPVWGW